MYLNEFLMIALAHFIALISPGADFVYLVNTSLVNKQKIALGASLGIALSNGFYILLCLLGYATIFSQYEILIVVIKILGGTYLLYLSIITMKSSVITNYINNSFTSSNFYNEVKRGFYLSFFNPKISIFYLALFTLVISPDTPLWIQLLYGLWMFLLVLVWDSMIVFILNKKRFKELLLSITGLEKVLGLLLFFISLGLFYSLL